MVRSMMSFSTLPLFPFKDLPGKVQDVFLILFKTITFFFLLNCFTINTSTKSDDSLQSNSVKLIGNNYD